MGKVSQKFCLYTIALLALLAGGVAFAAGPITVSGTSTLNFGTTVKPTSSSVKVVVTRNGTIGGATTATMIDTSNISAGQDQIKGSGGGNTIQVDFSDCSSNSSLGLSITTFRAIYDGQTFLNSAVMLTAPGSGKLLTYGATLTINSSASVGTLAPCYNIDVNYD